MTRFLYFIFIFTINILPGIAQTKVTVGKPYAVIDADSKYYFTANGEILTVKIQRKAVFLQKMNARDLSFIKIKM